MRKPNRNFLLYAFMAYFVPFLVVGVTLLLEHIPLEHASRLGQLRPMYGQLLCGVSSSTSKFMFVTIPTIICLIINLLIFVGACCQIKRVSKEGKLSSIPSSIRKRLLWYFKLSILLGIFVLFAFLGNVYSDQCRLINFVFLIVSSLHGMCLKCNLGLLIDESYSLKVLGYNQVLTVLF